MSHQLSLVVIARDEQEFIAACLQSALNVVDEIIVVDTGSTDETAEIARECGAKVIQYAWNDDFAAARNAGADAATGDWLLILDADERLAPNSAETIRKALRNGSFALGMLPLHHADRMGVATQSIISGKNRHGQPVLVPRLVRADARWDGVVHESVGEWLLKTKGTTQQIDAHIVHFGNIRSIRESRGKDQRNLRLLRRRCLTHPEDVVSRTYLARELIRIGDGTNARVEIETAWHDLCRHRNEGKITESIVALATARAFCLYQDQQYHRVIDTTQQAKAWGAEHPNLYFLEGISLEHLAVDNIGHLRAAQASLTAAMDLNDQTFAEEVMPGATSWAAATALGIVLIRLNEPQKALALFEEAIAGQPTYLAGQIGRIEAMVECGKAVEALAEIEPLLQDKIPDGWIVAAMAAVAMGEFASVPSFLQPAKAAKGIPFLSPHRKSILKRLQQLETALYTLGAMGMGAAHPANTKRSDEALQLGEQSLREKDLNRAADLYLEALQHSPLSAHAWSNLGTCMHAAGDTDTAQFLFSMAVEMEPTLVDPRLNLAEVLFASGSTAVAVQQVRIVLEQQPQHAGAAELLCRWGIEGHRGPRVLIVPPAQAQEASGIKAKWMRSFLQNAGCAIHNLLPELAKKIRAPLMREWIIGADVDAIIIHSDGIGAETVTETASELGIPVIPVDSTAQSVAQTIDINASQQSDEIQTIVASIDEAFLKRAQKPVQETPETSTKKRYSPLLSVIIPTYNRHDKLLQLLDQLSLQDLEPSLFEVIVIDDGSSIPVSDAIGIQDRPYSFQLLRQSNAGPARARNQAIEHATGTFALILNDDALINTENLRLHLIAQLENEQPEAVLGSFDFIPESQTKPFVALLQHTDLLFGYNDMKAGELYGPECFWTCNISLPIHLIREVGGFDEAYKEAICEDVELGLRLFKATGLKVRYRPDIVALHDHDMDIERYEKRQFKLGWYTLMTHKKHPDMTTILNEFEANSDNPMDAIRLQVEHQTEEIARASIRIRDLQNRTLPDVPGSLRWNTAVKSLHASVATIGKYHSRRGMVASDTQMDTAKITASTDMTSQLTSIIMPNMNGFPHVVHAVESLRHHTPEPVELIVVDNGSTDGSLQWLQQQPDVTIRAMGTNVGAPAARNRGLELARGESIVFCDNDVIFTPKWRSILIDHLQQWPDIGMVGPMTDYVIGRQKVHDSVGCEENLDAFAQRFHALHKGNHFYSSRLILFFVMARRELIETIGGIDERYGRWGFEDDDLSIRVTRAGFRQRVAADCFIRHVGSQTSKTAKIDYDQLLLENWKVFKERWGFDPALPYGTAYPVEQALNLPWDPERDVIPFRTTDVIPQELQLTSHTARSSSEKDRLDLSAVAS